jgi:hypothetical protein
VAEFTVGGKSISINSQIVEDLLEDVAAGPINKNFVVVRGRRFPVKQALSLAANIPLSDFISTEAVRVFKRLGFEVGRAGEGREAIKTESETLFELYLQSHGLGHYRFEPKLPGTSRRPDYVIAFRESQIVFEVKQFDPTAEDFNLHGGFYDPYGPIREKIEAGRKKFKDTETYACCLVLFNRGRPLVDLSWIFVYGAMLGNEGVQMPFDPRKGQLVPEEAKRGFYGGGKMYRYADQHAVGIQNQTISAIVVLDRLRLGQRRFLADMRKRERQLGHTLGVEESSSMLEGARGTERDWGLLQLRVKVYENPYARIALTRELFNGTFDERYGEVDGHITRVFSGEGIKKLEAEEGDQTHKEPWRIEEEGGPSLPETQS